MEFDPATGEFRRNQQNPLDGDLFVLDMGQPVKIVDLALDLARLAGRDPASVPIEYVGLRPGEKMREELSSTLESVEPTDHRHVRRVLTPRLPTRTVLELELEKLLRDPASAEAIGQLSDLRLIERLAVTTAGVHAMVRHDEKNEQARARRLAIVATEDVVFGMARMYQMLGGRENNGVGVFRGLDEALQWLKAAD